jgi:uncharacterized protein (DUF58 family)
VDPLETLIETTATLAVSWLRLGVDLRLVTSSGYDSGRGTGPAHIATILDALADAGAHDRSLTPSVELSRGDVPMVVVTTDRCTQRLMHELLGQRLTTNVTVVTIGTRYGGSSATGPDEGPLGGIDGARIDLLAVADTPGRLIHVPAGSSLGQQTQTPSAKS